MARDYTLRLLQSFADRAKNARKKGKTQVSKQGKGLKIIKPVNKYKEEK